MSREVRRVPADWQHPVDGRGRYVPLFGDSISKVQAEWDADAQRWNNGEVRDYSKYPEQAWGPKREGAALDYATYAEWAGERPKPEDYMPDWPPEQRTHLMMYETTSEGTPLSPAFATPEELARWLADTGASAFAGQTATYEQWLATCKRGWAPTAISAGGGTLVSGVAALVSKEAKDDNE